MREITVVFRSFRDVREFSQLAARQPFPILVGSEKYHVHATSILGMFTLACHKPLTAWFECGDEAYTAFLPEADPFLCK